MKVFFHTFENGYNNVTSGSSRSGEREYRGSSRTNTRRGSSVRLYGKDDQEQNENGG